MCRERTPSGCLWHPAARELAAGITSAGRGRLKKAAAVPPLPPQRPSKWRRRPPQNGAALAAAACLFPPFPAPRDHRPPTRTLSPSPPPRLRSGGAGPGGAWPSAGARVRTWRFAANQRPHPARGGGASAGGGGAGRRRRRGGRGGRDGRRGGPIGAPRVAAAGKERRSDWPAAGGEGRAAWRGAHFRSAEREGRAGGGGTGG